MPPSRQKRKRTPEDSTPAPSGQASLSSFFQRPRLNATVPTPLGTPCGSAASGPSARRPTTEQEEEEDIRRAIEASLREPSALPFVEAVGQIDLAFADQDPGAATKSSPAKAPSSEVIALSSDEEDAPGQRPKLPKVQEFDIKSLPVQHPVGHPDESTHVSGDDVKAEEREDEEAVQFLDNLEMLDDPIVPAESPPLIESANTGQSSSKAGWNLLGLGKASASTNTAQEKGKGVGAKNGGGQTAKRKVPFYKVLRGMPLSVDAFTYGSIDGCQGYFLTHFHSDHYGSLSKTWSYGPIYCSTLTAVLCQRMLGVDAKYLRPLDFDTPYEVPDSGGVYVTLIPANHCPGSALFLFEGPCTQDLVDPRFQPGSRGNPRIGRYLHCGDFRASPSHTSHPTLREKRLDLVYLDTTYCNPKYTFPPQALVIQACVDLVLATTSRLLPSGVEIPGVEHVDGTVHSSIRPTRQLTLPFTAQAPKQPFPQPSRSLTSWFTKRETNSTELDQINAVEFESTDAEVMDALPHDTPVPPADQPRDLCAESGLVVLIGTYTIGKERLVLSVAEALNTKIFCANQRQAKMWWDVARCADEQLAAMQRRIERHPALAAEASTTLMHEEISLARLSERLTSNPSEAGVHVVRLGAVSPEQSREYLVQLAMQRFKQGRPSIRHAISIRPTGWTFRPPAAGPPTNDKGSTDGEGTAPAWTAVLKSVPAKERSISPHSLVQHWQQVGYTMHEIPRTRGSGDGLEVLAVPYSEHSSFVELTAFALSLAGWTKIIPTVGVGSAPGRARMQGHFGQWSAATTSKQPSPVPRGSNYW